MAHLAVDHVAASFPGWIMATQDHELIHLKSAWFYNPDVHSHNFYHSNSLQLLASYLMSSQNQSDNSGLASSPTAARSCDNMNHLSYDREPSGSNYNNLQRLDYQHQPYPNLGPVIPINHDKRDTDYDHRPLADLVNNDNLRWLDISEESAAMYSKKSLGHEAAATAPLRPAPYANSAATSYLYTSTSSHINPVAGLASPKTLSPMYSSAGSSPSNLYNVIDGGDPPLLQQNTACELSSSPPPSSSPKSSRGDIISVPACNNNKIDSLTNSNSSRITIGSTAPAADHFVISTSSQQVVADGEAINTVDVLQAGAQVDQAGRAAIATMQYGRKRRSRASLGPDFESEFIHVRAKRGQATDSHSLAERVRRERINQRMKRLQDLVPSCHKITGKAMVLDEIINYIKSLQHQVEFLSMRLATVSAIRSSQ